MKLPCYWSLPISLGIFFFFFFYHSDLCILSFTHIELREVIQIDHILSLLFNVLLPPCVSFPTLFIYLTFNSSLNFSYFLLPSLVLHIIQVPTYVLQEYSVHLVPQHLVLCCDLELIFFELQYTVN